MFTLPPFILRIIRSPIAHSSAHFLRRALWLVPFIFFLGGYYVTQRTVGSRVLQAPDLIGKNLQEAVGILAPYRLNLRILDEIEEPALPEGTILDQHPAPAANIKIHQPLGIVISHQPKPPTAPDFVNMTLSAIQKRADQSGLRLKTHFCTSEIYPADQCIAQTPPPGAPVTEKTINVYIAAHDTTPYLLPSFVGLPLDRVRTFLHTHNIPAEIIPHEYARKQCPNCIVVAQKPLAGSFIRSNNPPTVQLSVKQEESRNTII